MAIFPKYDATLINEETEEKMDLVRSLISTGRYVREEAKIKVRQPLSEALIDGKYESILGDLVNLINEELNVKKVTYVEDLSKYMNFTIKPNFKTVGSRFGSKMKLYQEALLKLDQSSIDSLLKNASIKIDLDGEEVEVTSDMIDIRIESKPGFNVGMENNNFIILNTELTDELVLEGHAREIVSKVQNMRKEQGFDIADRIKLYYSGDEELLKSFNTFADYIKDETLSVEYREMKTNNEVDINGHTASITIEKY